MIEPVAAVPRALGRTADAVGHCVLVFAFVPPLAALPAWLLFEAGNTLNASDPVVGAFLPVRGAILLLHAFAAGVVPGVLAGMLDGLFVVAWVRRYGAGIAGGRRALMGALGGGLAALTVVAATVGLRTLQGGGAAVPLTTVAFEVGSGLVCGLLAVATAVRLAAGDAHAAAPSAS